MKTICKLLLVLPLLLAGCATSQHAWTVDAWGEAENDVRRLGEVEVKEAALPERILGDKTPAEEAQWQKQWPALFAEELCDGLNKEAPDLGVAARGVRKSAPHMLTLNVDTLNVGGSAWSHGSVSGTAELKRADGTLVVRVLFSWSEQRGMGEPDVEVWLDSLGMQLARWLAQYR